MQTCWRRRETRECECEWAWAEVEVKVKVDVDVDVERNHHRVPNKVNLVAAF